MVAAAWCSCLLFAACCMRCMGLRFCQVQVSDLHLYSPKVVRSAPLRSYSRTQTRSVANPFFRSVDQSKRRLVRGASKALRSSYDRSVQRAQRMGGLDHTGAVSVRHKQALLRLIRAAKANRHGGNLHHWRETRLVDRSARLCLARVRRVPRRCCVCSLRRQGCSGWRVR